VSVRARFEHLATAAVRAFASRRSLNLVALIVHYDARVDTSSDAFIVVEELFADESRHILKTRRDLLDLFLPLLASDAGRQLESHDRGNHGPSCQQ
jgi:hypothetical protein